MSLVTTLPEPIITSSPTTTPGKIILLAPKKTRFPILVFCTRYLPVCQRVLASCANIIDPGAEIKSSPISTSSGNNVSIKELL